MEEHFKTHSTNSLVNLLNDDPETFMQTIKSKYSLDRADFDQTKMSEGLEQIIKKYEFQNVSTQINSVIEAAQKRDFDYEAAYAKIKEKYIPYHRAKEPVTP